MTEEDSKVMKLLHNKEKEVSKEELKKRINNFVPEILFNGEHVLDVIQDDLDRETDPRQLDLDREMEERHQQRMKAEAVKEIFTMEDPDTGTLTFTEEELQEHVKDKIKEELNALTHEQFYYLAVGLIGAENTPQAQFEKLSKNKNYEVLKVEDGKYFITIYRPVASNQEVIVVKLPPKQN